MCHCPECSKYSESEQVLILDNAILKALQQIDPNAKLAYLAYYNTMNHPPTRIKPEKGIFLEFAPIRRSRYKSINEREVEIDQVEASSARTHGDILDLLDENLQVFGKKNAQILEYWLDVSLFSKWQKPAVKLPWNEPLFLTDIDTYAKKGIKNIKTFGVYIDSAYVHRYKDVSFIKAYGEGLYHYNHE